MSLPFVSRRMVCWSGATAVLMRAARPVRRPAYLFETAAARVQLTLEYFDQFERDTLRFREAITNHSFCASPDGLPQSPCPDGFRGSLAIVHYRFIGHGAAAYPTQLREIVRDVDRSGAFSSRPPFERAIRLQNGVGSDLQVFGLQGHRSVKPDDNDDDGAWFVLRQDLFLESSATPFLVLHWRHQLRAIRMLDLLPGPGTRQITEEGEKGESTR